MGVGVPRPVRSYIQYTSRKLDAYSHEPQHRAPEGKPLHEHAGYTKARNMIYPSEHPSCKSGKESVGGVSRVNNSTQAHENQTSMAASSSQCSVQSGKPLVHMNQASEGQNEGLLSIPTLSDTEWSYCNRNEAHAPS